MMWIHRRYTWHCDPAAVADVAALLRLRATERPQNFSDVSEGGTALGLGEVSLVVSDRDQWWIRRRVRLLTEDLKILTGTVLTNEVSVKLPPHNHPNRAARWRKKEAADG